MDSFGGTSERVPISGRRQEGPDFQLANAAIVEQFLAARRGSTATARAYRADLAQLVAFLDKPFGQLAQADVRSYSESIGRQHFAPATAARKTASLRTFLSWASARGIVARDYAVSVSAPRRAVRLPETLSISEVERLFDAVDHPIDHPAGDHPAGRDRLMLELLYGCGLRSAEACDLRLDDVKRDHLIVNGKGRKMRAVPYGEDLADALTVWLEHRPATSCDRVLITSAGEPLSTRDMRRLVAGLGRRAGVACHPHTLRHACATHMLEGGADILSISMLLGHSRVSTTQIYTHVSTTHLRSAYNNHPRA